MTEAADGPFWMVAAAALPSAISGGWVVWRWWVERIDRQLDGQADSDDRIARQVEAQRAALSREQGEVFDRIRDELVRCQDRLSAMERDRERGWDLARHWHARCHALRHAGLNAQAMVAGFCAREDVPVPEWPDMMVEGLEDPLR